MFPVSEPGGTPGASTTSVPITEAAGQPIALLVPSPICALVQLCRPCAADGLSVIPSGRATSAVFTFGELGLLGAVVESGTCRAPSTPSGWCDWVVSPPIETVGLSASEPQPVVSGDSLAYLMNFPDS